MRNKEEAFRAFTQYYEPFIFRIIHKKFSNMAEEDGEEIVQDVEMRAYTKIPGFDGGGYSFRCWLYKTTNGLCLNRVKKQAKAVAYQDCKKSKDAVQDAVSTLDDEHRLKEDLKLALEAIALLPKIYREVVLLRNLEELAYKEIAKILDIPMGTVKRRLNDARKLLRRIRELVEDCGIPFEKIKRRLEDKNAQFTKILEDLSRECYEQQ
ncbi:MAG: RNA polymerase sigma factor [bacterium]|nr:RNA polymerase sigma factor [bacterium]